MLDLAGADPEGQRPEGAMGGRVGVPAHDGHARLREAQLRADGVNDALIGVAQGMQAHAELGAVRTQCLDLSAAGDIGDGQVDVERGGVVVLGGQSQVRAANSTARQTQPLEGLGAGNLVNEVEIDVEQVGGSFRALRDDMVPPDLLGEGHSHRCTSFLEKSLRGREARRPRQHHEAVRDGAGAHVLA
jgi:flp pilus assembly protein tadG